jgi:hypothetical protein
MASLTADPEFNGGPLGVDRSSACDGQWIGWVSNLRQVRTHAPQQNVFVFSGYCYERYRWSHF